MAGIQKETVQDTRLRPDLSEGHLDRQITSGVAEPFWHSGPLRVGDSLSRCETLRRTECLENVAEMQRARKVVIWPSTIDL